ncbi:hypothetical protein NEUTE1DRAFT_112697 [Neurospora tetrasperma FGSC 2508]|uniref:Uncharacterized protein n=1 Tax=Neurospora tetrasperma (strain FGSC 2508 / ATCC MYA-4615 / P0657) TaxID=510951 RepID=F8MWN8_NEUT8|nr:uncharacterized protein NEUTE1DRAFT_112697 [Neurospora tetrasperma FGSC 2508]EGO54159.1 hypothetical protein NEUTE1DRAFT_112697 [Neurospora tetrasperma FGSC 2508]
MLDTEWRCNHCGHDHEYMGDDRREEKYVYIIESTSQATEVKGRRKKEEEEEEEEDIVEGKEEEEKKKKKKKKKEKKEKNKKENEKEHKGVVVSSDDTYHTLDYDENGNWVVLAGEQLVRFQVDDGAGQQVSGYHEQHGEGNGKKKRISDGETHAQLKQRARKDEQQQQHQQQQVVEEGGIQSSPGLFVTLVQKARAYRA